MQLCLEVWFKGGKLELGNHTVLGSNGISVFAACVPFECYLIFLALDFSRKVEILMPI